MTMRIIYLKIHDGHKVGEEAFTERSLARRLCENDKAIPYQTHLDNLYKAKQAKLEANAEAKAEQAEADAVEKEKADKEAVERARADAETKAKVKAEEEAEAKAKAEKETETKIKPEKVKYKKPGKTGKPTIKK